MMKYPLLWKVGPDRYKWSELTPIGRVKTPVTHLFSAIYNGLFQPHV